MGWKKMIMGEQMPDRNDPKYQGKYEQDLEAGRKFARFARLDKLACKIQDFATRRPQMFLRIVFAILAIALAINIQRIVRVTTSTGSSKTAIEHQEERVRKRQSKLQKVMESAHCITPPYNHTENTNN